MWWSPDPLIITIWWSLFARWIVNDSYSRVISNLVCISLSRSEWRVAPASHISERVYMAGLVKEYCRFHPQSRMMIGKYASDDMSLLRLFVTVVCFHLKDTTSITAPMLNINSNASRFKPTPKFHQTRLQTTRQYYSKMLNYSTSLNSRLCLILLDLRFSLGIETQSV